ncbi:alpha/beta hydrolase fold domain-containing protein [Kutzneria sp. NPDC052558]|uniref:alpha/beta hydrolase fold domain-containing protein n=1 Tax=Kutzneria sp. NPDC052558 TaxID=3364121 RepID=UPI0037C9B23F
MSLRVFQPAGLAAPAPALLWTQGGGFIFGAPEQDDRRNIAFARQLGITVAAVRYRLAPDMTVLIILLAGALITHVRNHDRGRDLVPATICAVLVAGYLVALGVSL